MPRYFFNITDGRDIDDREGVELAGVGEARDQAIKTAGKMIKITAIRFGTAAHGS